MAVVVVEFDTSIQVFAREHRPLSLCVCVLAVHTLRHHFGRPQYCHRFVTGPAKSFSPSIYHVSVHNDLDVKVKPSVNSIVTVLQYPSAPRRHIFSLDGLI